MTDQIWRLHVGSGPLVATAIHDGHEVRDEVLAHMALSDLERLREEDPVTSDWTVVAPTRIVGLRSRFEVTSTARAKRPSIAPRKTPGD